MTPAKTKKTSAKTTAGDQTIADKAVTSHVNPPETDVAESSMVGKNTMLEVVIPWADMQKGYAKALDAYAKNIELDGFRKGKAPVKLVEEKVGAQKLYEAALEYTLPEAYANAVQEKKLQPITQPHVSPKATEPNNDWVFDVEIAEAPQFELGDWRKIVKNAKPSPKIWTPQDGSVAQEPSEDEKRSQHLQEILKALLDNIKFAVPELLIREEVNASLTRLLTQLEKLKVSLDDYMRSTGKSADMLRQEYASSALASLQLEFILARISAEAGIQVEEKELDDIIATIPDPELRERQNSAGARRGLESSLLRRKTLDFLLGL